MASKPSFPITLSAKTDNEFHIECFADIDNTVAFDFVGGYTFLASVWSKGGKKELARLNVTAIEGSQPPKKSVLKFFMGELESDKLIGYDEAEWDLYIDPPSGNSDRPFKVSKVTIQQARTDHA